MQGDRLTGLDASFLHLEDDAAHMHVASCMVFEGEPPTYDELLAHDRARLHLVPRYRQRLAFVPFGQGRPVWVDDPHFNLRYHVRHTALPAPGSEEQLQATSPAACSRSSSTATSRCGSCGSSRASTGDRFALLGEDPPRARRRDLRRRHRRPSCSTRQPEPRAPPDPGTPWVPRPLPTRRQLLGEALLERATVPAEIVRGVRARRSARRAGSRREAVGDAAGRRRVGLGRAQPRAAEPAQRADRPAPPLHLGATATSSDVKAIKNALGGTVNDVVLAAVAGALGRYLRAPRRPDRRARAARRWSRSACAPTTSAARSATRSPRCWRRCRSASRTRSSAQQIVRGEMEGLKESGQAVGAQVLTELTGFAPPTVMAPGRAPAERQRFFNLVVTNVPGPQIPLYVLGPAGDRPFPMVPLAKNQGARDRDHELRRPDGLRPQRRLRRAVRPRDLAADLADALDELAAAAGRPPRSCDRAPARTRRARDGPARRPDAVARARDLVPAAAVPIAPGHRPRARPRPATSTSGGCPTALLLGGATAAAAVGCGAARIASCAVFVADGDPSSASRRPSCTASTPTCSPTRSTSPRSCWRAATRHARATGLTPAAWRPALRPRPAGRRRRGAADPRDGLGPPAATAPRLVELEPGASPAAPLRRFAASHRRDARS